MVADTPHRSDIDGLRGVAILCVVLYHACASVLPGGYVGVDVFFVLSGYLITGILLNDLTNERFSIARFYARRIRRILPSLLTMLTACAILGWFILLPTEYASLGKHIGAGSFFFSNIALWKEAGYFDTASDLKPLLHLWSLGLEEQFYLLWPIFIWLAWRWRHVRFLMLLLAVASLIASILLSPMQQIASFYLPTARFWELMAGGLLAYHTMHGNAPTYRPLSRNALSFIGLVAIIAAALCFDRLSIYPGWRALVPVMGSIALIAAGIQGWVNRCVLSSAPLVWLGLISYPLYLWHWPLLAFLRIAVAGEPATGTRIVAMLLALLLAWLTTRYIELPIRFGRLARSRRTILVLCFGLTVVGALGYGITLGSGFPAMRGLDNPRYRDLAGTTDMMKTKPACRFAMGDTTADWCITSRTGPADAAVYGDSHAEHLFPGLADDAQRNWLLIGLSSCPPLAGIDAHFVQRPSPCAAFNARATQALAQDSTIHTVVLAALGPYYFSDMSFAPDHRGKYDAKLFIMRSNHSDEAALSKEDLFYRGMDRTITRLERSGKEVVLFIDVPELDFMPERCLQRPLVRWNGQALCGVSKARVMERTASYRALMQRLAEAHPKAKLFDPYLYLCDDAQCYAGDAGMLYYHDSHHLSTRGSAMLMGHFTKWLDDER